MGAQISATGLTFLLAGILGLLFPHTAAVAWILAPFIALFFWWFAGEAQKDHDVYQFGMLVTVIGLVLLACSCTFAGFAILFGMDANQLNALF